MKVRVKFSKYGPSRFLGHLDVMRYFQKAVRRAGIPIAFSSGFRPHMIMSFAAPLGLGVTSDGEYFDMELSRDMSSQDMIERFNEVLTEGFQVTGARKTPEGKKHNAMALTAAASYRVRLLQNAKIWPEDMAKQAELFCAQPSILVEKETKSGSKMADIKPGIYQFQVDAGEFTMLLSASSANYVKPKMVMEAFANWLEIPYSPYGFAVHKTEVYANRGMEDAPDFVPLEELGEDIE